MPRESLDGIRTHVILTKVQDRSLRKISDATGMTLSEHLRRAVDYYLAAMAQQTGRSK